MSLDERFRHIVADALAGVQTRLQSEFETTLGDLRVAVARERDDVLAQAEAAKAAAVAEARDTLQRVLREAFDAERASLLEAHAADLARARAEADQTTAQIREEAERAELQLRADGEATAAALRDELREAQAVVVRQRDELEQAAAQTAAAHQAEVARLAEALASASGERDELRAVLTRVQEEQAAAAAQAEQTLAAARAEAEATILSLRSDAEAAQTSLRARAEDAVSTLTRTQGLQQASGVRMLESVRALDGAASLPEVLDALAHGAGKESGRAAVLVVKGDRLIGWRSTGFGGIDDDPRSVQFSTGDAGALAVAVNTGRPAAIGHGTALAAPAFSHMDASGSGLAVPLLVAGKPVAVVYAEADSSDAPAGWASPVELLTRHAGRCIEALAVQRPSHTRASGVRLGVPA